MTHFGLHLYFPGKYGIKPWARVEILYTEVVAVM
jgi:hypothetical protein